MKGMLEIRYANDEDVDIWENISYDEYYITEENFLYITDNDGEEERIVGIYNMEHIAAVVYHDISDDEEFGEDEEI